MNTGIVSLGTGGTGADTARADGFGTGTLSINTGGTVRLWIQNSNSYTITNAVSINGGTLNVEDGNYNLSGAVTVGSSGANFGTKYSGKNLVLSGAIGGSGPVSLSAITGGSNSSTITFSGANTYSGATAVNAGMNLILDYSTNDNSKLGNAASLTLSGSTVTLSGGTHAEVVGSTILSSGTVNTITRTSGTATIQLGAITRNTGSTLNLGVSGIATTTTANDASGIIGVWATVGGADLATSSGGSLVTYTGYTNVATAGVVADNVLNNVAFTGTGTSSVTLGSATTSVNTITQSNTGATTVDVGRQTLRLGAAGGILAGTGKGALTLGVGPNSGSLTAGGTANTAGTLMVNNAVTTSFNLQVVDNGTGAVSIEKLGTGTLVLSGNNSYTGTTLIGPGTVQIGSGGGSGSLGGGAVTNNGTLSFNRINSLVVSNVISGTGALTQSGVGTTILTATNTYSGLTTVSGGILQVGNGGTSGTLGSGLISVGASGILSFNRSDAATLSTSLTGSTGTLRMDGTGTLNITSGATVLPTNLTVNSGTVNVSGGTFSGDRLQGSGQIIINTGGTLVIVTGNAHALGGDNNSMGEAITINGGTMTFNQEQYVTTLTLNGALVNGTSELRSTSSSNYRVIGTAASTISARVSNVATTNFYVADATNSSSADLIISGQMTNTGALVKTGIGTLSLSGASNSYSGATTITNGGLLLDFSTNNNTKLADAAALTLNGATVTLSGGSHTEIVGSTAIGGGASAIVQTGGSAKLQMGALSRSAGGTLDIGGTAVATTATANDATGILGAWATIGGGANLAANDGSGNIIAYTGYTDVAFAAAIADSAASNVRLNGGTSGNLTLAAATTTVNTITQNQTTATTIDTSAGVLRLGAVGSVNVGTGKGALTIGTAANSGSLTAGGATNVAGELILNANGAGLTVNSTIANNGTGAVILTKSGSNTLTLTGTNTYTGGTNLNAGTLSLGSAQAIGTTGTILFSGGFLQFTSSNITDYSARFSTAANQQYNFDTNGQNTTIATALTSSGGNLVKIGSGTLTLSGASTFINGTSVVDGTLALTGGTNRLSSSGYVTLGNGTTSGKLSLGGTAQTVAGLSTLGSGSANAVVGGNATASALTVTNATVNTTYAGAIGGGALNENNITLTKSGNATFTLTGASTYTGLTTVSGGTLAVGSTGSLTGTIGILINSGGTFTNSGNLTIAGTGASDDAGSASSLAVKGGGIFNQTGGTVSLAAFGANGVTNISGGSMTVSGAFYIGEQTTNPGIVNQTGGTVTLTSTTTDAIRIGHWNNPNGGTYNLTGGTLDASGGSVSTVNIGWDGRGEMNVGGGAGTATFKARAIRLDQGSSNGYADTLSIATNGVVEIGTGGISSATTNDYVILSGGIMRAVASSAWSSTMQAAAGTTSAIDVGSGFTVTSTGAISGTGALNKTGAGEFNVSASSTYSGGTSIAAGTIRFADAGSSSALGTGTITFTGNATIVNGGSGSATVKTIANGITVNSGVTASFDGGYKDIVLSGVIGGAGNLSQASTGLLVLANDNTYAGTTATTGASTLQIGNGGTTGSLGGGAVSLASGSTLKFNRTNTYVAANAISGAGAVTQAGTGTTTLSGSNSYSGATTISSGTLQIGNGGTTGSLGSAGVTNNGALAFNRTDTVTVSNAISGSGAVNHLGSGTTILTGVNSYGATTISSGTLQIGSGGTAGSLGSGAVTDNATLAFNRSDAVTVGNAISGSGAVTHLGSGTTTFTGANSYGTTTISSGTLQIGSGGTTGTLGSGAVTNNSTLAFNRSNAVTVANDISGSGAVTHLGSGTTTFTGSQQLRRDDDLLRHAADRQWRDDRHAGQRCGDEQLDPGVQPQRRVDGGQRHLRQRCGDPRWQRHDDVHRLEQLRHDDDYLRHAADRQWRDDRHAGQRRGDEQLGAGVQPQQLDDGFQRDLGQRLGDAQRFRHRLHDGGEQLQRDHDGQRRRDAARERQQLGRNGPDDRGERLDGGRQRLLWRGAQRERHAFAGLLGGVVLVRIGDDERRVDLPARVRLVGVDGRWIGPDGGERGLRVERSGEPDADGSGDPVAGGSVRGGHGVRAGGLYRHPERTVHLRWQFADRG